MDSIYQVGEKTWAKDQYGWYWTADLFEWGMLIGITGNYYELWERLSEKPKDTHGSYYSN